MNKKGLGLPKGPVIIGPLLSKKAEEIAKTVPTVVTIDKLKEQLPVAVPRSRSREDERASRKQAQLGKEAKAHQDDKHDPSSHPTQPEPQRSRSGSVSSTSNNRDSKKQDVPDDVNTSKEPVKKERKRTESEQIHSLIKSKRLDKEVNNKMKYSYRERVQLLNQHLGELPINFDIPRVGPG